MRSADAGRILHTPCFDKELIHCFVYPALGQATIDLSGCFQPSGRMTNKQRSLSSKVHYLKRGAAPRPRAPPARRIRPPLAPRPRVVGGGSSVDTDSRAPGKIESNMVTEEVSFAITSEERCCSNVATPPSLAPLDMIHSAQGTKILSQRLLTALQHLLQLNSVLGNL